GSLAPRQMVVLQIIFRPQSVVVGLTTFAQQVVWSGNFCNTTDRFLQFSVGDIATQLFTYCLRCERTCTGVTFQVRQHQQDVNGRLAARLGLACLQRAGEVTVEQSFHAAQFLERRTIESSALLDSLSLDHSR